MTPNTLPVCTDLPTGMLHADAMALRAGRGAAAPALSPAPLAGILVTSPAGLVPTAAGSKAHGPSSDR